jgi:opacity protein-like surface antigen
MKKIVGGVLLLLVGIVSAQQKKISLEANYPILVDQNFMGKHFKGKADLGVKYRFATIKSFQIGVGINGSYFVNDGKPAPSFIQYEMRVYMVQPKIFVEYRHMKLQKWCISFALGYTTMDFKGSATTFEEQISSFREARQGINTTLGLTYDLTKNLFSQIQYDFSKMKVKDGFPDVDYNTNVTILKVGLGYRF